MNFSEKSEFAELLMNHKFSKVFLVLLLALGTSSSFIVQAAPYPYQSGAQDSILPVLSNGAPSENLLADTTSTPISLQTNENATCKYSTVTGTPYTSMTHTFTTTGMTNHSTVVSGLTSGGSYTYFVRCQDFAGNATTSDFSISFSVWSYPKDFGVYDALLFTNKPDLRPYGLRPNWVVYTDRMWPPGACCDPPNEQYTRQAADTIVASGYVGPVQLDLEQWPYDIRFHSTSNVDAGVANIRQVLGWFKNEAPKLNVGLYYVPPISDYRSSDPQAVADWKAANDYLAPLTGDVGSLYPQAYTLDADQNSWVEFTRAKIAEAKRISSGKKHVYVYIWPQYHGNAGPPLAGTYVDYTYWKLQLQTIKNAGADGIIMWGGNKTPWDDSQGWWQATREFMQGLHPDVHAPSRPTGLTVSLWEGQSPRL